MDMLIESNLCMGMVDIPDPQSAQKSWYLSHILGWLDIRWKPLNCYCKGHSLHRSIYNKETRLPFIHQKRHPHETPYLPYLPWTPSPELREMPSSLWSFCYSGLSWRMQVLLIAIHKRDWESDMAFKSEPRDPASISSQMSPRIDIPGKFPHFSK